MTFLAWAVRSLLLQQGAAAVAGYVESGTKARAAQETARALAKPFLVVGGPHGSLISGHLLGFKAHGCGDT